MGYRFRARAFNFKGFGPFSPAEPAVFPPPIKAPCPPTSIVSSTEFGGANARFLVDVSYSSASLNSSCAGGISGFKIVGDSQGAASGADIVVEGAGQDGPGNSIRFVFVPGQPGDNGEYRATCSPPAVYRFRAAAINSFGQGLFSGLSAADAAPSCSGDGTDKLCCSGYCEIFATGTCATSSTVRHPRLTCQGIAPVLFCGFAPF
ncbi:hypothetical protein ABPG75_005162 [Micractinium tetrahymenae]